MLIFIIVFVFISCAVSWLVTLCLLRFGFRWFGSNNTQYHHAHREVIPRIGGIGIMISLLCTGALGFIYFNPSIEGDRAVAYLGVVGGAIGAFLLGLSDDFRPLGAKLKLLIQILIALFAYQSGLSIDRVTVPFTQVSLEIEVFGLLITVGWFVAVMNLINLVDGLDGLAGGIGLMLMLLLAYLGIQQNMLFSSIFALGMIGAILGFLLHNFPPAKCYMGDSGAYLIGYMIAALSLLNSQKGAVMAAMIGPAMALALPILDVAFALFRRGVAGLPLFRPDRGHIHHQIVRAGLSRRNALLMLYAISLFALIGGLLSFVENGRHLPIFFGFAFVIILFVLRGQKISTSNILVLLTDSLQSRQDIRNALYLKEWLLGEVERADKAVHLWSDFRFVVKKMGFYRVELIMGEESREFYVPNTPNKNPDLLWREAHTVEDDGIPVSLTLYGGKDNFSKNQFAALAGIAIETWTKVRRRWKEINGKPMDFNSVATEPTNYREQKARNLYRPTY